MNLDMYEALQALSVSSFVCKVSAKRGKRIGYKRSEETIRKAAEANRGQKRTEETCRNISAAKKGYVATEETRKKLSIAGKGRVVSEETRKKISAANTGRIVSEETRKKLSIAATGKNIGKKISEEARLKLRANSKTKKAVRTPIGIFDSLRSAAEALNVHGKTIRVRIYRGEEGYAYI